VDVNQAYYSIVNFNQNTAVLVSNVSLLENELVRNDALAEVEMDVDPIH